MFKDKLILFSNKALVVTSDSEDDNNDLDSKIAMFSAKLSKFLKKKTCTLKMLHLLL